MAQHIECGSCWNALPCGWIAKLKKCCQKCNLTRFLVFLWFFAILGQLGIKNDLYALFACMLTGRPWESVIAGVNRIKPNDAEKELVQNNSKLVLPSISDILEQVDRQMLLILKTNDLIRNIETTLQTQSRMTSFWVMSKCCLESVARQEIHHSTSKWQRIGRILRKNWLLFKLNIYYMYLGLSNFNIFLTLRQFVRRRY